MIFTTNKPLNEWGNVLHEEDMAAAILNFRTSIWRPPLYGLFPMPWSW
jgi:hypothetical protein